VRCYLISFFVQHLGDDGARMEGPARRGEAAIAESPAPAPTTRTATPAGLAARTPAAAQPIHSVAPLPSAGVATPVASAHSLAFVGPRSAAVAASAAPLVPAPPSAAALDEAPSTTTEEVDPAGGRPPLRPIETKNPYETL